MQTSWLQDLKFKHTKSIQVSTSMLAYIDDTIWIAHTKNELEQIINTASSFYQIANIQVNPLKSILITNSPNTTLINFINQTITPHPKYKLFKFLGCWFTLNHNQKQQTNLILEESNNLINILKTKQITDKQAAYIINTVIIPTLEYRIHNLVLPQKTCNQILSSYLTVAKHKANLPRSIPNSIMLNHNIYGIKNIWDIQLQHHISRFLNRINNTELLRKSTKIRIQQLQNNLWSTTNILQHSNPIIDSLNKHTTNFKIIQLLNHLGAQIIHNTNTTWPTTITHNAHPIESLLHKHE